MQLEISQDDVDKANSFTTRYCPTEYAMLRAGYINPNVGFHYATAILNNEQKHFDCSDSLTEQINNWCQDETGIFVPGIYELIEYD